MIGKLAAVFALAGLATVAAADSPRVSRAAAPRVFTAEQAKAGRVAYESSCGLCHQFSLQGRVGAPGERPDVNSLPANMIQTIDDAGGRVPPLVGPAFMARWGAKSTKEYASRVATAIMGFPPTGTNGDTWLQLTAYFLKMNGGKPGTVALTADTDVPLDVVTGQALR